MTQKAVIGKHKIKKKKTMLKNSINDINSKRKKINCFG